MSKPKTTVTYLPPVDPAMQKLSALELVAFGETGEKPAIAAGLELLRRKRNRIIAKKSA